MDWLQDVQREFKYSCSSCKADSFFVMKTGEHSKDPPQVCANPDCAKSGIVYQGFSNTGPVMMQGLTKTSFDQNGRLAYKIGNTCISQTKYNYLETGKIEGKYTKDYQQHLEKHNYETFLDNKVNSRRGKVSKAPSRFALKAQENTT